MEYRYLGNTGVRVSELCLGTMTFGWKADELASHQILDLFAGEGGNFIDTADVYADGKSEEILGNWLTRQDRDDFLIATKVRFSSSDKPNDIGLTRKHILSSVKKSLKRLKTDYIDLYQVHAWDPAAPLHETLKVLNELVSEGTVRYIGASNFRGWQLQKAIDISESSGWARFNCLQPQYNLLCRATEFELLPVCIENSLGVIPWSPLRGGILSGKYRRGMDVPPESTRIGGAYREGRKDAWERYNNETTWNVVEALDRIAAELGKTDSQIALNWVLNRRGVTSPITGAVTTTQLHENLGATGWKLDAKQVEELDRLSSMNVSYPYDEASEMQQRRGREDFFN
jgi:aryl-alcohol dehydrogenase-like predicted oxidoreductase